MTDQKTKKPQNDEKEEIERSAKLMERYHKRLSTLKLAHEYAQRDNIVKAVEGFNSYLKILADYHRISENQLNPSLFDREKDVPEMLLISQVYWGLAKAYDRNPNLHHESRRCLAQLVKFSTGFKYQYLNSEMIRKFLRRKVAYQPKAFQKAYDEIQVDSKKCFIASYCFGEEHLTVNRLRDLKSHLQKYKIGKQAVFSYYRFSPKLVIFFKRYPLIGFVSKHCILKPILTLIAFFTPSKHEHF